MRRIAIACFLHVLGAVLAPAAEIPTPEFYGVYIVSGEDLLTSMDAVAEGRMGRCGTLMGGVEQGVRRLSGLKAAGDSYFLVYGKEFESLLRARLARLEYKATITVGTGLMLDPKQSCRVEMWMRATDVPLKVAPVRTVPDLYRIVPATSLTDGIYALYYGSMNTAMVIEGAAAVFDFAVGDVKSIAQSDRGEHSTPSPPEEGAPDPRSISTASDTYYGVRVRHLHDLFLFTGKCEGLLEFEPTGITFKAESHSFSLACSDVVLFKRGTARVWESNLRSEIIYIPCIEIQGSVSGKRKTWQFIPKFDKTPIDQIISEYRCPKPNR